MYINICITVVLKKSKHKEDKMICILLLFENYKNTTFIYHNSDLKKDSIISSLNNEIIYITVNMILLHMYTFN